MGGPRTAWWRRAAAVVLAAAALMACAGDPSEHAAARQASSRADLLGGPRALGTVGDYVLENAKIRVVIQGPGASRGFGVFGGSLLDAAPRVPREASTSAELPARDRFGELFPAFFLQAVAVDRVEVVADGSDGGAAIIEASGLAGDFLEVAGLLNRLGTSTHEVVGDATSTQRVRFSTRYTLEPGSSAVQITFRAENISDETLELPGPTARTLLPLVGIPTDGLAIPIGQVALFSAAVSVFLPGIGFDVRFGLERSYEEGVELPAFPGAIVPYVAARGEGVSYGIAMAPSDDNYLVRQRAFYAYAEDQITNSSMLVPFVSGGFLALFQSSAPATLGPGEAVESTSYFVVGTGDVASVYEEVLRIRGDEAVGTFGGRVYDAVAGAPSEGARVLIYRRADDGTRSPWSQNDVHEGGAFRGRLEAGAYSARTFMHGAGAGEFVDFDVRAGEHTALNLSLTPPGRIVVHVVDRGGARLPAAAIAVGTYGAEHAGAEPRSFLFDLAAGESFRVTDFVPDTDDVATRRYIETSGFTDHGVAELLVRPGTYEVWVTRGPEYDVRSEQVTVGAGQTATVGLTLTRVVDTTGWIAFDTHVHTINSLDASYPVEDRVRSLAATGVEWAIATDHNYVTDYEPAIAAADLSRWMRGTVGLELTTLESGHFNGYPLRYAPGPITHGAIAWSQRPPAELFAELREAGKYGPDETIVQVNHPRDSILGYFNQYNRDALTAELGPAGSLDAIVSRATGGGVIGPYGPAFFDEAGQTTYSSDFDAIELLNGKLQWTFHHFRTSEGAIVMDDEEVAHPGAIDDWYNLLNLGYRYIAVGSSDAHEGDEEAGYFRTMVHFGSDDPRGLDERGLAAAVRTRRVYATNGPFVDFWVGDATAGVMGRDIVQAGPAVDLGVTLTSAPWVSVERVNVVRNGVLADVIEVDPDRDLAADPLSVVRSVQLATDPVSGEPVDSWFVVEVIGRRSFFPMVRPLELPPFDLTDALGSIAGALGFGDDGTGPPQQYAYFAYALTNPVWVHTEPGEFDPPGIVPIAERSLASNDPGFPFSAAKRREAGEWIDPAPVRYTTDLEAPPRHITRVLDAPPSEAVDIRRVLQTFEHGRH